ncbi:caspase domain-containing protein [Armillaria mellea]|nr:caspase domain-containing protein [Armillaria mellea]
MWLDIYIISTTIKHSKYTRPKEIDLIRKIRRLENIEKKLAKKYRMSSVDSVEVLQTAQQREDRKLDADAPWESSQMHILYHYRKDLNHLRVYGYIESEVSLSPSKPPPSINPSRFWAVIIGIDHYKDCPLRGCVSDAKDIAGYLLEDLGIAKDHVQLLLSGSNAGIEPTRENIVKTLLNLSTDPCIKERDNIIISFSGHGSSYRCRDYSPYSDSDAGVGTMEAMCPVDRGLHTPDGDVPDISDREINSILSQISRTKGNHITFILDCCHASSLTRAPQGEGAVRAIKSIQKASSVVDMLQAADRRLRNLPEYRSVLDGDWVPDMNTHVILAACTEYQYATEIMCDDGCHGIFTQGLTKALKSATDETTYFGLLEALPSTENQTPVIAGQHRNAKLWHQDSGSRDEVNTTSSGDGSTSGFRAG